MKRHHPLSSKADSRDKADNGAPRRTGAVTLVNSALTGFLALYTASKSSVTALIAFGLAVCLTVFYLWLS